jgi:hypothetical protein
VFDVRTYFVDATMKQMSRERYNRPSAESGAAEVGVIVVAVATRAIVAIVVGIVRANWRALGVALVLRVLRTRAIVVVAASWHGRRTRTNGERWIAAEHSNARSVLGATE